MQHHIKLNNKCPLCRKILIKEEILPTNPNLTVDNDIEILSEPESHISSGIDSVMISDISDDESDNSSNIDNNARTRRMRSR